jgi:small subunit ribosomal protein S19
MARSLKKGPYVDEKLLKKVERMNQTGDRRPIKTWARSSMVSPEFVGHTLAIHNGNKHLSIFVTENMVGHRLGEFAPTRAFRRHGAHTNK